MIRYKLTDQNMETYNHTKWEIGISKHTDGSGGLCSSGWLHCYSHPLLAVLLNPIHAKISNPLLFKCDATGNHKYDMGLKEGSTTMVIIKELPLPSITLNQKIAFGILCSLEQYKEPTYVRWALNWLNNTDRSESAAESAAESAWNAAWGAAESAWSAAESAESAAKSAESAAKSAAWSAAESTIQINFLKLAKEALKYQ